jgi:hypothetical protein
MNDSRNYWVVTFTLKTWAEALAAGGNIVGFRSTSKGNFQKIAIGDYFLCYLIGISRFVAVQEVESEPFLDDSRIWEDDPFPFRVMVKTVVKLEPETAVPVVYLSDKLSIFENLTSLRAWGVHFRTSPKKWKREDGEIVVAAVKEAAIAPVRQALEEHPKLSWT